MEEDKEHLKTGPGWLKLFQQNRNLWDFYWTSLKGQSYTWMDVRVVYCRRELLKAWEPENQWSGFCKSVCKETSVYYSCLFICLKELAQGILGWLCLSKAILTKKSPKRGPKNLHRPKGQTVANLASKAIGGSPQIPQKPELLGTFCRRARFAGACKSCKGVRKSRIAHALETGESRCSLRVRFKKLCSL
jgi:hypothetical protein